MEVGEYRTGWFQHPGSRRVVPTQTQRNHEFDSHVRHRHLTRIVSQCYSENTTQREGRTMATIELRELYVRLHDFHVDANGNDRSIARQIVATLDDDINDSGRRPSVRMAMWSAPVTPTLIGALVRENFGEESTREQAAEILSGLANR